jgi:hypothetical protein
MLEDDISIALHFLLFQDNLQNFTLENGDVTQGHQMARQNELKGISLY